MANFKKILRMSADSLMKGPTIYKKMFGRNKNKNKNNAHGHLVAHSWSSG